MASLKNRRLFTFVIFACALFATVTALHAELPTSDASVPTNSYYECQIDPKADSNFSLALFRVWLPESKTPVKGVLAVLPGSDGDGTPIANDSHWQAIARKWNYALLGITFTTRSSTIPYYRAESGSGLALLSALDQLSVASGHAELKGVPIAILGHSQGGQFAVHFACWKPSLVAAFATIKGGYYDVKPTDNARAVPGLLITAEEDAEFRRKNIRVLYDANSTPAARWAFASEPKAKHELGRSLQLIIPFFQAVINDHLQPYSGDLRTLTIRPVESTLESGHPWFPNRDVAEIWTRFMNGTLQDSNPDLRIAYARLPRMAHVSPSACDFGNLEIHQDPPSSVIHVKPLPDGPAWTSIRAFSLQSRCDVSVSRSGDEWLVSVRPKLYNLPLGRINDTIHIRYLSGEHPIYGGSQLNMTLNHTSADVKLSATCFYLGVHSKQCERTITITTVDGKLLKLRSVELLMGVAAKVSIVQKTSTSAILAVVFLPLPESGEHSGIVAVHLNQPLATTIMIPFAGFYRQPDLPSSAALSDPQ